MINESGGRAISVPGDILNSDYIIQLVNRAAEFGGRKIHIIVNNAGFAWDDSIEKIRDEQWGMPITVIQACLL